MKFSTLFLFVSISWFSLKAQNVNLDFEATPAGSYTSASAVSGWTISSQYVTSCGSNSWVPGSSEFSIVSTPIFSYSVIGPVPNSPLGGNNIAVLNNLIPNLSATKISRTYSVSWFNSVLAVAYAGVWDICGTTNCCEHAGFKINVSNASGGLSCQSYSMSPLLGCSWSAINYTTTSNNASVWTNWKTMYIDLSAYIGTNINLDIISTDCIFGGHKGSLLFDIKEGGLIICSGCDPGIPSPLSQTVNFCPGTSNAVINGPLGYTSYSWTAPAGYPISASQATMASLTLTNAVAGNVYTLAMNQAWSQCVGYLTYTLATANLTTSAVGASPSCSLGASGSATVVGYGSGTGYNYAWTNSSNSVIATTSVISGLSPGVYSVTVSAAGSASSSCGSATNTVTINATTPAPISLLKPYCGTSAFLCAPSTGTNYQWHQNLTPISPTIGGTASCYTVNSPANGTIFRVGYNTNQGCRDSVNFILLSTSPGSLGVTSNPLICPSATNGAVSLSVNPAVGSQPGLTSFTVVSTGTQSPSFSSIQGAGPNTYTANSLAAGPYSVTAFDGLCFYSASLTVTPFNFSYSVSPSGSSTLCSGSPMAAGVTFSNIPASGLYTYSWSPGYALFGGNNQNVIISASLSPGTQTTVTYTVIVTPTIVNCPQSKTLTVTMVSPVTPSLSFYQYICADSNPVTITANPSGGTFVGGTGVSGSGVITPSLSSSLNPNTFTYTAPQMGTCAAVSSTANYYIVVVPSLTSNITGNASICAGQSLTLTIAPSFGSYGWNTGATTESIVVSPTINTVYTATYITQFQLCASTLSTSVFVTASPTINISGPNSICLGDTAVLNASGASSYTWSTGPTGSIISVSPNISTAYTVLASNSPTCPAVSAIHQVQVVPKPILSVAGNTSVCEGQSTTLLATGANSYTWNNQFSGPVFSVTPQNSTTYTLVGKNGITSCTSETTILVNVIPLPQLSFSGDTLICNGDSTTLNVSGAFSYSWTNGSTNSWISVSPATSTLYFVTGYNVGNTCSSSLSIPVMVNVCTGISESQLDDALNVYPNPASGLYAVDLKDTADLIVYDVLGKILLQEKKTSGKYILDLRHYANGTYFLKVVTQKENQFVKLIKNN